MKPNCPSPECRLALLPSLKSGLIVRNGSFRRSSDCKVIRRFQCLQCFRYFSWASENVCKNQKKRRINSKLKELLCSGVSQRRAAIILKVNRKTIVRRMRFLAREASVQQALLLREIARSPLKEVQFDDLETSEHTKYKPLSVILAVDPNTRKILNFKVSRMPAKGLLARKALKKYGYRKDERSVGWEACMRELKSCVDARASFTSDENPHYPRYVRHHHPEATHIQVKGGRGCITGQGELKKLHYDPLFCLNHTCAMLRANLNRLFRRTWCTTKNKKGLEDHLNIFVSYYNATLLPLSAG